MLSRIPRGIRPLLCGLLLAMLFPGAALAASVPFTDVPTGAWYESAVSYVYGTRLMSGMESGVFSPGTGATRGQIVTILYRIDGEPGGAGSTPFQDVPPSAFYAEPVSWAYHFGIVNGVGPTTFEPNKIVNREQMMTILFRFGMYQGWDMTRWADISGYTDAASVSDYAQQSVSWAVGSGVLQGTPEGALLPKDTTTRAHMATVFMRINELFDLDLPVIEEPAVPESEPAEPGPAPAESAGEPAEPAPVTPAEEPAGSDPTPASSGEEDPKEDPIQGSEAAVRTPVGQASAAPKSYVFQWPVQGTVTSKFGEREIFGSTSFHRGIDISVPLGVAVHAGNDGKVTFSGERGTYGNLVILDHGNGFVSYYAHNSKLLVKEGDQVTRGQTIAAAGSTGRSTGNHCHFELHYNGELIDPFDHLPEKNNAPANTYVVMPEDQAA